MEELTIICLGNQLYVDSREIAKSTKVRHTDLARKIKYYIQVLENAKLRSQDFFVPSTYKTERNNKTYLCYLATKKGCDMVANKMTGEKGILFTAIYWTILQDGTAIKRKAIHTVATDKVGI